MHLEKLHLGSQICVVGLGKLGAPMAAIYACKGYKVLGVDVDPKKVGAINQGKSPVFEPDLEEWIKKSGERLRATDKLSDAVENAQATFVIVPTPTDAQGAFSLKYVLESMKNIGEGLKRRKKPSLVVLTSTVLPGSTGTEVRKLLESSSGKKCGIDFGLCYSPEFIALGSVIHDFLNPDFVLIGESDRESGNVLEAFYKDVCDNSPEVARMNLVNAEITKLAVNTYVTTKITFANMLTHICEKLPGANVDTVTSALGLDKRIGRKYLKGAVGYGGPCFPRDNIALSYLARKLGTTATLAEATDQANRQEVYRLADLIKKKLPPSGTAGILGIAYKPNTEVVEESQGLLLAQELLKQGIKILVYDPVAMESGKKCIQGTQWISESMEDCVRMSDLIVIMTPWACFKKITPELLQMNKKKKIVIDCWRFLEEEKLEESVEYIFLGRGPESELSN